MKGTHQGHNWNKPRRWDGRSDAMDAKRLKRLKKRKYSKKTVDFIYTKYKGLCADCGGKDDLMKIHHILPISEGGTSRRDNLVLLCDLCEDKRHGRTRKNGKEIMA